jgi:hypothetical protein
MTKSLRVAAVAALASTATAPGGATTIKPLGFEEMVRRASLVAQGRVVKVESFRAGGTEIARNDSKAKDATSPSRPTAETAAALATGAPAAPVSLPTEGGRMIFTRVRFEVDEAVKGEPGGEVEFVIAGGTVSGRTAKVWGLPVFEEGSRYLLFLREGRPESASPIVGVNQGFFRVVRDDATGVDLLQKANGEYVTGIEADRVQSAPRRVPGVPRAKRIGPPTPDAPGAVKAAAAVREAAAPTPLSLDEFAGAVRRQLEQQ